MSQILAYLTSEDLWTYTRANIQNPEAFWYRSFYEDPSLFYKFTKPSRNDSTADQLSRINF